MYSSSKGKDEVVKLLITAGADVNKAINQNQKMRTPMKYVWKKGEKEVFSSKQN